MKSRLAIDSTLPHIRISLQGQDLFLHLTNVRRTRKSDMRFLEG